MSGAPDSECKITVLYFAVLRERLGLERETLTLSADILNLQQLSQWLEARHPALRGTLSRIRFAVGEEFASLDRSLVDGDEVALLPPLSGG